MKSTPALFIVALMLSSLVVPLASTQAEATSGRAGPDFAVIGLTLDNGGSVQTSNGIVVAPGSHTIRIEVVNVGTSTGAATLAVTHRGSPTAFEVEVDTLSTGMLAPGASSSVYLVDWVASTGLNQTLFARTTSLSDGNTGNDDRRLDFDVQRLTLGRVIDTVHPEPQVGLTTARLNLGTYDLNATVRNDGVMPVSAVLEVVLTSLDGGPTITAWSNTIPVLAPGSLHAPSSAALLSYALDASSMTGEWNLTMTVLYNGSLGSTSELAAAFDVMFSDYTASLDVPADRVMQPGTTRLFTFSLENTGSQLDAWTIGTSSLLGWVDTSSWPASTGVLASGGTSDLVASVSVPITAPRAQTEVFVVTFTSNGATPAYSLQAVLRITAGELFNATVDLDNTSVEVVPGQEHLVSLNVTNTGNVPAVFVLAAGFSPNPSGWISRLTAANTGYLQPSETVVVQVGVTPAHISTPLDPSERNRAGDVVDVWVSASANGGAPITDAQSVTVAPVIVVDPGLSTMVVELSRNDVLAAQHGIGFDSVVPMNLQVRHNLVEDLNEVLNATVEISEVRFTSSGGAGGFSEVDRWSFEVTPENASGLALGSTTNAALGIQGPADALPLAGIVEADVTVTPVLSGPLSSNGVSAAAVTRSVQVVVPGVTDGGVPETDVLVAELGVATTFDIAFENLGNDVSDYRISLLDTLPITWSAFLDSTQLMTEITSLPSPVATYPTLGTAHQTTFPLTVTSDPLAQAGSITYVDLQVEDLETGAVLQHARIPVTVEALVDGALAPAYQLVNLSIYDTPLTSFTMRNTGNTPAEFLVEIDDPADEVDFVLTSSDAVLIGAGFSDSVKVELVPSADAAADVNYSATVTVTVVGGPVLHAVVQANISAMDDVTLLFAESLDSDADLSGVQHNVVPGTTVVLGFDVINDGNFLEDLTLEAEVDGGWGTSLSSSTMSLPIDQSEAGALTLTVPALGGSEDLISGDVHTVRIYVNDSSTGILRTIGSMDVVVAPLFDINSPEWPDELLFHRGLTRTVSAPVINVGNSDIEVLVSIGVYRAGLTVESDAWSLSSAPSQTVLLPRNKPVLLDISITLDELEPTTALQGELRVTMTPVDESVTGSADLETLLGVSRLFQVEPEVFMPALNDAPKVLDFLWTHIPSSVSTAAVYEIELCSAERLINPSAVAPSIDAADLTWAFDFVTGEGSNGTYDLDLDASGCSPSNPDNGITLPLRQAWTLSGSPDIVIDAPNRPNLLPGDGWDLTFRLYHPDEHAGYSVFTEATFTYKLDSKADPAFDLEDTLDEVSISGTRLMEGVGTEVQLDLINYGTSLAIDVRPLLTCEGATVEQPEADPIMVLAPNERVTVAWRIVPETFDWWLSSSMIRCEASWDSPLAASFGDNEANNVLIFEEEVVAWSPRALVVLIGAATGLFLAAILLALRNQNDNFRLAAVYAGLLGLGFSFHLMSIVWWGPAVLVIAALWTWSMSWRASEEFRVLHEDYQRQRKGLSTIYADHFEALADTQRALSVILAMPVFGFMLIVLGVPAQVPETTENIAVLLTYLVVVSMGVVMLMRRANKTYGRIYGRLTDIETSSARIERDLADPARLLGDLAEDGLGLADLLDEASQATRDLSDDVEWENEGVNADA